MESAHQRSSAPAQAEAGATGPAEVAKTEVERLQIALFRTLLILPKPGILEEMQRRSEEEGIFQ